MLTLEFVQSLRQQFPALARRQNDQPVVYLDGPAGTQVPRRVIDAIADYLSHRNANHGGLFATSRESDAMLDEAHRAFADLLGADDPDCVYFGPNMTTLTFALSRAVATTWRPGDEIIVTRL
ncbi:MAG: aminotransferase class V-fold PLP-dependent enzyme, partial [Planctomycetales bacterium]|nr:aminotransferase class V-fold PLP-dependent enzyme [Planctomycetales bacterium]